MGIKEGLPTKKVIKVSIEDHNSRDPRIIATGKFDLAHIINVSTNENKKTVYEDINLSQNLGLMQLRITPKKMELREKVKMALTKPPVPYKINAMPVSPRKYQKEEIESVSSRGKRFGFNIV